MAGSVAWSPEAVEDLEAIAAFIERDSSHYAKVVVSRIVSSIEITSEQPRIGRVVPEIRNERIRELFAYRYRVIYEIRDADVLVVAVIHGSRNLAELIAE